MKSIQSLFLLALLTAVSFAQGNIQTEKAAEAKTLAEAQAFEKELIDALRKGDRAALERMIAVDGFIFIHSTGGIETREQYIQSATAGRLLLGVADIERSDETWRIYEGTTALRYARSVMRNKAANTESRMRNIAVFVKTVKGWQWVSGQSTRLPVRPKAASIDVRLMDEYAGKYEINSERSFTVTRENGVLYGLTTGRMKTELIPISYSTFQFFSEENDFGHLEVTFTRDAGGNVSEAVLHQSRQEVWRARKIK